MCDLLRQESCCCVLKFRFQLWAYEFAALTFPIFAILLQLAFIHTISAFAAPYLAFIYTTSAFAAPYLAFIYTISAFAAPYLAFIYTISDFAAPYLPSFHTSASIALYLAFIYTRSSTRFPLIPLYSCPSNIINTVSAYTVPFLSFKYHQHDFRSYHSILGLHILFTRLPLISLQTCPSIPLSILPFHIITTSGSTTPYHYHLIHVHDFRLYRSIPGFQKRSTQIKQKENK